MLLIPIDRKIDWNNAPVVTLLLVAINVLVYFAFQSNEEQQLADALDYYFAQGLDSIEYPAYTAWLKETGQPQPETVDETDLLFKLQFDAAFMRALEAGEIIATDDDRYHDWSFARRHFNRLLDDIPSFSLGIKGGAFEISDLFAHMFLHGDLSHLIGNMIFLFAVGFLVEAVLGHVLFAAAYLVTGLAAALPDVLMHTDTLIPSIGASGAIAGLMGLYAVMFGLRRVRFFYFVGVYFDYVRAPALILFILWLGNEIYQQLTWADYTNVNYMAHIAGLIAGGVLALVLKLKPALLNMDYLDAREKRLEAGVDEVLARVEEDIGALRFEQAARRLRKHLDTGTPDLALLTKLYDCAKHQPESENYHWAALRILAWPSTEVDHHNAVLTTYRDYTKRARPKPRLGKTHILELAERFLAMEATPEAERLVRVMLKHRHHFPNAPTLVLKLANLLTRSGRSEQGRTYLRGLLKLYPQTQEAGIARDLLK